MVELPSLYLTFRKQSYMGFLWSKSQLRGYFWIVRDCITLLICHHFHSSLFLYDPVYTLYFYISHSSSNNTNSEQLHEADLMGIQSYYCPFIYFQKLGNADVLSPTYILCLLSSSRMWDPLCLTNNYQISTIIEFMQKQSFTIKFIES